MTRTQNSREVVTFMVLFERLRGLTGDDPSQVEARAGTDDAFKGLCNDLGAVALSLSMNERRQRKLFAAPVDPTFIGAWRAYEENYAAPIAAVSLSDLGLDAAPIEGKSRADILWTSANDEATAQAAALEHALDFALEQATDDRRDFSDDFRDRIEEGVCAWQRLKSDTGLDLRGIFRRRELIPFVLIPRNISKQHGDMEDISLLTQLREAHDAFVFGAHFATLALMRSVLETTLRLHYQARGEDLKERIENCQGLPPRCSKPALHRIRNLANDILHLNNKGRLPDDLERELLRLLNVLRALIEAAPSSRSG